MSETISNSDDVIDSRDVIARIEELTEERDDLKAGIDRAEEEREEAQRLFSENSVEEVAGREDVLAANQALVDWREDGGNELNALEALQEEAEGYCPDWKYGVGLIRDTYFEDYARELASDLYGKEVNDAHWPFTCIDWEQAAEELQQDYTSVEFDGVTYWVR